MLEASHIVTAQGLPVQRADAPNFFTVTAH
jgi:hypothetical protein